jgi:hypothetical protein
MNFSASSWNKQRALAHHQTGNAVPVLEIQSHPKQLNLKKFYDHRLLIQSDLIPNATSLILPQLLITEQQNIVPDKKLKTSLVLKTTHSLNFVTEKKTGGLLYNTEIEKNFISSKLEMKV